MTCPDCKTPSTCSFNGCDRPASPPLALNRDRPTNERTSASAPASIPVPEKGMGEREAWQAYWNTLAADGSESESEIRTAQHASWNAWQARAALTPPAAVPVALDEREMFAAWHWGDEPNDDKAVFLDTGDLLDVLSWARWGAWQAARATPPAAVQSERREYKGDGMFAGESVQDAARGWAQWCEARGSYLLAEFLRVVGATPPAAVPVDMVLYCPNCGKQHIDAPNTLEEITHAQSGTVVDELWTNPPHRSHLCHGCGCIWRPADVPTNGVSELKTEGKVDTWPNGIEDVKAQRAALTPTPLAAEKEQPGNTLPAIISALDDHHLSGDCVTRIKHLIDLAESHKWQKPAAVQSEQSPEVMAENYIAQMIDRGPEPLRRLADWLSKMLDEDDWKGAERMLLGAYEAAATPPAAVPCPRGHLWNDFGQLGGKNVSWCCRCDSLAFTGQEPAAVSAERAWEDLPAALQAHPGVKALYRAGHRAGAEYALTVVAPAQVAVSAEPRKSDHGLNKGVAMWLKNFLQPGEKVIWREPFRWHGEDGVLSNHYEMFDLPQLAADFGYEIVEDFHHAAIVRAAMAGFPAGDASHE